MNETNQCNCCGEMLHLEDAIKCKNCKMDYHFGCVGFTENYYRKLNREKKLNIKCKTCKKSNEILNQNATNDSEINSKGKSNNAKLEVRVFSDENSQVGNVNSEATLNAEPNVLLMKALICDSIRDNMMDLKIFIHDEISKANCEIKDEIRTLKITTDKLETNIIEIKQNLKEAIADIEVVKNENKDMRKEIQSLKSQLNIMEMQIDNNDQYTRKQNMEISNLPQTEKENLHEIINKLASVINRDMNEIDVAHRITTKNKNKPNPVIIKFKTLTAKQSWKVELKNLKIYADELNFKLPKQIVYFNDQLTVRNKKLMYLAKQYKIENNYKYLWYNNGKIMIRKDENAVIRVINSEADLTKF